MEKILPKIIPRGFTLVELLVVVAVIAILSVIGITIFTGVQKNARDARRKADINNISKAWEARVNNSSPYYPALKPGYFAGNVIPTDPADGSSYDYNTGTATNASPGGGGNTYKVCAYLEAGPPPPAPKLPYCLSNQQ